jgi:predicted GTPase
MTRRNVLIMGAAGRDFHNFNVFYRGNENYNVVALLQHKFLIYLAGVTLLNLPEVFILMG